MSVLITGMSGVGKSTLVRELGRRGYSTCDADTLLVWEDDWVYPRRLPTVDFLAGTAPNQRHFSWEAVVLLTAPLPVMMQRIAQRTDNPFGKTADERAKITEDTATVVPLLRSAATHELDATMPVGVLADELVRILEECRSTKIG